MTRQGLGIGAILVASVLFGAMAVSVRIAAAEMAPLEVAFFRFAGALGLMLATAGPGALRARRAPLRMLVLRGLLGATAITLWFHGIRDAGAAVATLLHATYPVWATVLAVVLLGERFSRRTGLALAVQLAGVALVLDPAAGGGPHAMRGALLSVTAGMLAGAAVTTARQLRATEGATVITTWFMLVGAVCTAPALIDGLPAFSWPLGLSLAGVVLASAGGQWLLHHGLGFTSAAQGSLAAATSIVSAAALEAMWLGTAPAPRVFAGAALMATAVALAAGAPAARRATGPLGHAEPGH